MTTTARLLSLSLVAIALLFAACDDGGANDTPREPRDDQFLVQSFTLKGTTAKPAEVTVNGQADADGKADTSWQAEFILDDGTKPGSLPKDDGYERSQTATVEVKTADGKTTTKKVTVTFHE